MKFLDYQTRWINDRSRLKVLEKSRRIGGTYSTSYGVFRELMERKGHDIIVVTRDENLATEFVGDVSRWVMMWNALTPNNTIDKKHFKRLSLEIPHHDGFSRLLAVSSNPNAAIGKGGSLIIDELAVHKDADLLMTVAQPIIMAGGNLSVLSTHRSRNSRFNEIVTDAKKEGSEWSLHSTTIYDAVEQGLVEQIVNPNMVKLGNEPWESREAFINWLKSTYDEFTFQQEFCCVPSDDACSLLSYKELDDAKARMAADGRLGSGIHYLGYDCAESINGDYATICVIRALDHEVEVVDTKYFDRGTPIGEQIDTVVKYARKYHVRRVVGDNAGIGRHPCTILGERLGEHMVVPFNPTMQSKGEMCTKVKRYFQNRWVRMRADKMVEDDFLSIDRLITPSGNIVYNAVKQNGSHGDMFSAFAMALTEVDEHAMSNIKGISNKDADPFDRVSAPMTIREKIALNRKLDKKDRNRFTY